MVTVRFIIRIWKIWGTKHTGGKLWENASTSMFYVFPEFMWMHSFLFHLQSDTHEPDTDTLSSLPSTFLFSVETIFCCLKRIQSSQKALELRECAVELNSSKAAIFISSLIFIFIYIQIQNIVFTRQWQAARSRLSLEPRAAWRDTRVLARNVNRGGELIYWSRSERCYCRHSRWELAEPFFRPLDLTKLLHYDKHS